MTRTCCVLLTAVISACGAAARAAEQLPNIVIMFTDDQGYQDVGCFGSPDIDTPHLDRMAKEGIRFTDFYAAQAVCSASRAALITGCYSNRVGILGALGPQSKHGIHADELTIAELVKQRGYATAIDGRSILPLMQATPGAKSPREAQYFYWGAALQAVRSGKWKLHFPHAYRTMAGQPGGTGGIPTRYSQGKIGLELFDLENDIAETTNVAEQNPEVMRRMLALAEKARADLGDLAAKRKATNAREPGRLAN